ncbi:MAG: hypothetical protein ACQETM_12275 [Bacteroidota bacterium]
MKPIHRYSLVNELCNSEDAKELLMTLVAGTSQYHSLKHLRSWETKEINDDKSEKLISDLDEMRGNITHILKNIDGDLSIEIRAEIRVASK